MEAVKFSQANEMVKMKEHMHNNYGIEEEDEKTMKTLKAIGKVDRACQGTPWYNITSMD